MFHTSSSAIVSVKLITNKKHNFKSTSGPFEEYTKVIYFSRGCNMKRDHRS